MSNKHLELVVMWDKSRSGWVIKFWSDSEGDWLEDSFYPVKDVDPDYHRGWVSEILLCRLMFLHGIGYEIHF